MANEPAARRNASNIAATVLHDIQKVSEIGYIITGSLAVCIALLIFLAIIILSFFLP